MSLYWYSNQPFTGPHYWKWMAHHRFHKKKRSASSKKTWSVQQRDTTRMTSKQCCIKQVATGKSVKQYHILWTSLLYFSNKAQNVCCFFSTKCNNNNKKIMTVKFARYLYSTVYIFCSRDDCLGIKSNFCTKLNFAVIIMRKRIFQQVLNCLFNRRWSLNAQPLDAGLTIYLVHIQHQRRIVSV